MELRSRRRLSETPGSGKEKQPRDTVGEVETKSQCSNITDEDVYSISINSDSNYEDEESGWNLHWDLNQEPTSRMCVLDEDNASDSSDGSKYVYKRGKPRSAKKRKKVNSKHGEQSDVETVAEHGDNEELTMVFQQSVPIDLTKTKKNKTPRKTKKGDSKTVLLWNAWEEEQERWIDENLLEDVDLDHQSEESNETAEAHQMAQ